MQYEFCFHTKPGCGGAAGEREAVYFVHLSEVANKSKKKIKDRDCIIFGLIKEII